MIFEKVMKSTEKQVGGKQRGFRKGRGCSDLFFSLIILTEKYMEKSKNLYVAFMDRVDRKAM